MVAFYCDSTNKNEKIDYGHADHKKSLLFMRGFCWIDKLVYLTSSKINNAENQLIINNDINKIQMGAAVYCRERAGFAVLHLLNFRQT